MNKSGAPMEIVSASFAPSLAVTGNDTNFLDFSIEIATVEVASETTETTDLGSLVAGTPVPLVLSGDLRIEDDEVVECLVTHTGTGQVCHGAFALELRELRG